jgi:hypothetical protein
MDSLKSRSFRGVHPRLVPRQPDGLPSWSFHSCWCNRRESRKITGLKRALLRAAKGQVRTRNLRPTWGRSPHGFRRRDGIRGTHGPSGRIAEADSESFAIVSTSPTFMQTFGDGGDVAGRAGARHAIHALNNRQIPIDCSKTVGGGGNQIISKKVLDAPSHSK